jgi:hypothetical protein
MAGLSIMRRTYKGEVEGIATFADVQNKFLKETGAPLPDFLKFMIENQ